MERLCLRHRAPVQTHVFAPSHPQAQLQALKPVQAVNPLMIDRPAFSAQHHVDTLITKPRTSFGNLTDAPTQRRLVLCLTVAIVRRT